jgi:hypothetical protein
MRREGGIDQGFLDGDQSGQRAFLIGSHQAVIAGDLRRQHCRKPSLYTLTGQECPKIALRSVRNIKACRPRGS